VCWTVACVLFAAPASALVVRLEPGERECFMLEVQAGAAVSGNFELIKPTDTNKPLPLAVTLTTEDEDQPLYEIKNAPDGTFALDAKQGGIWDLCIANGKLGKSDGIARSVGFAIRVTSQHTVIDDNKEDATAGSLNDLLELSEQLNEGLLTLTDHQTYMRQREATHEKTLRTAKARVYWWTVAESVVLFILAVWQIVYIRQFFEIKRRV